MTPELETANNFCLAYRDWLEKLNARFNGKGSYSAVEAADTRMRNFWEQLQALALDPDGEIVRLVAKYNTLIRTPVVDDDFPQARFEFEQMTRVIADLVKQQEAP